MTRPDRPFRRACIAAGVLAMLAAQPASAVDLGALTAQVNPKTEAVADIQTTDLAQDADGGFAAVWARFEFSDAQTLFARFYTANGKPDGKEQRFDARVNGVAPDFNTLSGAVRIGNGKVLAVWGAQYPDKSKQDPLLLGQVFDKGEPAGKLKRLARPDIWPFRAVQLPDGRALLAWLPSGRIDDAEGGFVGADAIVRKPYIKLMGEGRVAEDVAGLAKGFVSAFSRTNSEDGDESFAQRFDEDGRKTGGVIRLLPPQPLFVLDSLAVVGLASGGFVALGFLNDAGFNFTGDVVAQAFSRSGAKVGKLKTLAKSVPNQPVTGAAVSLPDGGFLLALAEGKPFGDKNTLTFTRYDDALAPDGKVAETKALPGVRRGALRLLDDGRAAAIYDLQGEKVFVQIVKP